MSYEDGEYWPDSYDDPNENRELNLYGDNDLEDPRLDDYPDDYDEVFGEGDDLTDYEY